MVLHRHSTRSWSSAEIAAELRIPEGTADDVLEQLASSNFLAIKISNDILYRFNPATPVLSEGANRCAEYYVSERISVINLVTTGSRGAIRHFAEAFRLKTKDVPDA